MPEARASKNPNRNPMGLEYFTLLIYHKNQPNVGRYTSPMDPIWNICPLGCPVGRQDKWFNYLHLPSKNHP